MSFVFCHPIMTSDIPNNVKSPVITRTQKYINDIKSKIGIFGKVCVYVKWVDTDDNTNHYFKCYKHNTQNKN